MGKGLPKKYAKMGFKTGWAEYKKVHGKKKSSGSKKKSTGITVGRLNDYFAIGGPAAYQAALYMQDGNVGHLISSIPKMYTSYNPATGVVDPGQLVRGYGGIVTRKVLEKNVLKFAGVRPPPTKVRNWKDLVRLGAYYGKTAVEVWENKDNPSEAIRQAYRTQNGIALNRSGMAAIQPFDMLTEKLLPYIVVSKILPMIKVK